jgi:hypothetical protein
VDVYTASIPHVHETSKLSFAPSGCRVLIDQMMSEGKKHFPRLVCENDLITEIYFMAIRRHMQLRSGAQSQGIVKRLPRESYSGVSQVATIPGQRVAVLEWRL